MSDLKTRVEQKVSRSLYQLRERPSLIGLGPIMDRIKEVVYSDTFPTCATDGRRLIIGCEWTDTLPDAELRGVMVHEMLHVSLAHHVRLREGEWDQLTANKAMDYVINGTIMAMNEFQSGWLALPKDGCFSNKYGSSEWTWESVYREIYDPTQQAPQPEGETGDNPGDGADQDEGDGSQQGSQNSEDADTPHHGWGTVLPAPEDVDPKEELEGLDDAAAEGEFMEKMCGTGKGSDTIMGKIRDVNNATIADWSMLQDLLRAAYSDENTWTRPNVVFLDHGYLPARKKTMGTLHAMFDMSASMSPTELQVCAANLSYIGNELGLTTLKVGYFDHDILRPDGETWEEFDIASGEVPEFHMLGRGGTDFSPIFQAIEDEQEDVNALVIFTDGEAYVHNVRLPGYEVIWCITDTGYNYGGPWFDNDEGFGHRIYIKIRHWWEAA